MVFKLNRNRYRPYALGAGTALTVLLLGVSLSGSAEPSLPEHGLPHLFGKRHLTVAKGPAPKSLYGGLDAWVATLSPDGTLLWKQQLGSKKGDGSLGVATDSSGNVLISGVTQGNLGGPVKGVSDAFVTKYSPTGTLLWTKQLGSSEIDSSFGVATDNIGNVLISGETYGDLGGGNPGHAFVAKYSPDGTLLWTQQQQLFSPYDVSEGVATDRSGNVLISGWSDGNGPDPAISAWVAKYGPDGTLLWKKQLSAPLSGTFSQGVATDGSSNVLISGQTGGNLGGPNKGVADAWVAKYSPDGTLLWKKQLGSSEEDYSLGVATDSSGNVLISGYTAGNLGGRNKGSHDAFVAKYSPDGTLIWKKQLGSSQQDGSYGVATDGSSNVLISGWSYGNLNRGSDAFVAKYSPTGTLLWKKQLGSRKFEESRGVATDSNGNVVISGWTDGEFFGTP